MNGWLTTRILWSHGLRSDAMHDNRLTSETTPAFP